MPIKTIRLIMISLLAVIVIGGVVVYRKNHNAAAVAAKQSQIASEERNKEESGAPITLSTDIKKVKADSNDAIDKRLKRLGELSDDVKVFDKFTDTERQNVTTDIETATIGLNNLKAEINTATVVDASLTQAVQDITHKYPVFSLVDPKVQLLKTTAKDRSVLDGGTRTVGKLNTFLNNATKAGRDKQAIVGLTAKGRIFVGHLSSMRPRVDQAEKELLQISLDNPEQGKVHRDAALNLLKAVRDELLATKDLLKNEMSPLVHTITGK